MTIHLRWTLLGILLGTMGCYHATTTEGTSSRSSTSSAGPSASGATASARGATGTSSGGTSSSANASSGSVGSLATSSGATGSTGGTTGGGCTDDSQCTEPNSYCEFRLIPCGQPLGGVEIFPGGCQQVVAVAPATCTQDIDCPLADDCDLPSDGGDGTCAPPLCPPVPACPAECPRTPVPHACVGACVCPAQVCCLECD